MSASRFSLEGKVALVTGASRGIGRATALAFADAGADVAVASRKIADLEAVAEEIRGRGRKSVAIAAHIGRLEQIQQLVADMVAQFGRIDVLINNAGTSVVWMPALDIEERAWDSMMNLNLKGLFFLSQAVARVMKEHGGGRIVNIASVDGIRAQPNNTAYCISKAAVIMATQCMAREWAEHGIGVNCIAPGFVSTRLLDSRWEVDPENKTHIEGRILIDGITEPDSMVGAMLFLASDASHYMTGQTFAVDGGYLLA
jgi:NAD(P)-dependent dehydrogenase (short-subunit alcohol dehydrogenase family)